MSQLLVIGIFSIFFMSVGTNPARSDQFISWIDEMAAKPDAIEIPIPQTQTLYRAGRTRIPFKAGDETSLSQAIKEHEGDELVELAPAALFELLVREAAAGTRFADKININRPYRQGYLNVYTYRDASQIDQIASCAFVGHDAIIVCQSDRLLKLITAFVTKDEYLDTIAIERKADGSVRVLKRSELDQQTRDTLDLTLAGGFLGWILAHEIGHAVLHADKLRGGEILHFAGGVAGEIEHQADEFAAKQILHSDFLIQMTISSLNEFVAFEYLRFYSNPENKARFELTDAAQGPLSTTLRAHLSEKNPEEFLFYRAASINSEVTELDPTRDTTGIPQAQFANLSIEGRSNRLVYYTLAASAGVIALILSLGFVRGRHA
jgi:hypothetical protein